MLEKKINVYIFQWLLTAYNTVPFNLDVFSTDWTKIVKIAQPNLLQETELKLEYIVLNKNMK